MNRECREVESWLSKETAPLPEPLAAHAAGCSACAARLQRRSALDGLLSAVPTPAPPPELRGRVMGAVAERRAAPRPAFGWLPSGSLRPALALAAVLLLAVAIVDRGPARVPVLEVKPSAVHADAYVTAHEHAMTASYTPGGGLSAAAAAVGFPLATPENVPDGFRLVDVQTIPCPCACDMTVAQLIYSDGQHTISVFQQDGRAACSAVTSQCRERVEGTGRCVATTVDGLHIVGRVTQHPVVLAVGEAPERDLAQMAASVPTVL